MTRNAKMERGLSELFAGMQGGYLKGETAR